MPWNRWRMCFARCWGDELITVVGLTESLESVTIILVFCTLI